MAHHHNVAFDRVDVHHVVVTPATVLAVELPRQSGLGGPLDRDLRTASNATGKVRPLLRSASTECRHLFDVVVPTSDRP
jgi:hypothetical protein